ncbi:MAG TPA: hypothetical protein ENK02_06200 [Planctomycetes bacterium]|nr:hypothetical protein [Planctomycetota bacterium]
MLSLLLTCSLSAMALQDPGPPKGEAVRGITISTHGMGREWADPEVMQPTLKKILETGAEWIALHPYARIHEDGRVTWRRRKNGGTPSYWSKPIALAHKAGLKILIKPHIAYWGTRFAWRGEIAFKTEAEWERFFQGYRDWILALAEASRDADGFVVGTELDKTLGREKEWRALIAEVRKRTKAPLTYAANWTDYERVPFWDALDVVGIQAYFPLTEARRPDDRELDRAWEERMKKLRAFAKKTNRNIVFTEIGYNRSHKAAREPWTYRTDGADAKPLQRRCLGAALRAIEREPCVLGAFLWKWFPEPYPVGRNFQLATKEIRALIRKHWRPEERKKAKKQTSGR